MDKYKFDKTSDNTTLADTGDIIPFDDNLYSIGSLTNRYHRVYANTDESLELKGWPGVGLELDSPINTISVLDTVTPETDKGANIGSALKKYKTISTEDGMTVEAYYNYDVFNSGPVTAPLEFTKVPITSVTQGPYDAGNNEIKFPTKGIYLFSVYLEMDIDTILGGTINSYILMAYLNNERLVRHNNKSYNVLIPRERNFEFAFNVTDTGHKVYFEHASNNYEITNVITNITVVRIASLL